MLYLSKESMPHQLNSVINLLIEPVRPEDVQEKRSRPEELWRNSCILWKTNLPV